MAGDPFGSAISALSVAWRPRSGNVGNQLWGGGPDATLGVPLAGSYGANASPDVVGTAGWGLGLNRGSATQDRNQVNGTWFSPNLVTPSQVSQQGGPQSGSSGPVASLGGDWAGVDKWNAEIQAAASTYGVPANLLKSIMKLESGGDPGSFSPQSATGLMQIMPMWDGTNGLSIYDNQQNVLLGAYILKESYDRWSAQGAADPWQEAVRDYIGRGGPDAFGTDQNSYWTTIKSNWDQLNGASGGAYTGAPGVPTQGGGGGSISSIWGNAGSYPITQEMGLTDFAQQSGGYYDYARAYHGFEGHPGLDVGTPSGTKLYTPVSGTVVFAGGSGYYANYGNAGPGVGEFRIRLDNGDELILGHMSQINVQPGQRISAGTAIGLSGGENGDHVHVEYRQSDGQNGFYIKDPRQMFGGTGAITGGTPGGGASTGGFPGGNWWDRWYSTGAVR